MTPAEQDTKRSREEAQRLRSSTEFAKRRTEAHTADDRLTVEWAAFRARIKRQPNETEKNRLRDLAAQALARIW